LRFLGQKMFKSYFLDHFDDLVCYDKTLDNETLIAHEISFLFEKY
jgi:hypothetical protein